ncbi:MAG: UDP-N-acetylenolpyruvoylglucosamine reductase, partial [Gemmatimonadetes bacterium]|nr:UDP-N-acetylenolpyruvoylglucosamine reductase [Gemmatimonadota bacterium]
YEHHANIIVNLGGATAKDVITLMDLAKEAVQTELGLTLVPEITLLGEF